MQEVQGRHEELRKMESSIEELATLFMDLQVMLEVCYLVSYANAAIHLTLSCVRSLLDSTKSNRCH